MSAFFALLSLVAVYVCGCPCKMQTTGGGTEWGCYPKNCAEAGDVVLKGTNATKVTLAGVNSITSLTLTSNSKLTLVSLSDDIKSIGKLVVLGSPALADVHSPNLATADHVQIDAASVDFPALSKVNVLDVSNSIASVIKLPALATAQNVIIANNSKLSGSLNLLALSKVTGDVYIGGNKALTMVHFNKATDVAALSIMNNAQLAMVVIDGDANFGKLRVAENPALTTIIASNVTKSGEIEVGHNDKLSSARFPSLKTAKALHVLGLADKGCVLLDCFDKVDDFAVFLCSHINKTAPLCSAKAKWDCRCH